MTNSDTWTLADHAEFWQRQRGKIVPSRDTEVWREMYEEWVTWAFAEFRTIEELYCPECGCDVNGGHLMSCQKGERDDERD